MCARYSSIQMYDVGIASVRCVPHKLCSIGQLQNGKQCEPSVGKQENGTHSRIYSKWRVYSASGSVCFTYIYGAKVTFIYSKLYCVESLFLKEHIKSNKTRTNRANGRKSAKKRGKERAKKEREQQFPFNITSLSRSSIFLIVCRTAFPSV